ncbi:MAG: hypothetical protein JOZ07_13920 [Solirubrobacterales bacterium]|nr:hypothetical protein [Solirubrobacterales bacterium]
MCPRSQPAAAPTTIGVVGAGTMGAGIAQVSALAGARTLLYDPIAQARERAVESIERRLARMAQRERISESEAAAARERLSACDALDALAEAELVIEAAPEDLELKHETFAALAAVVSADCVLATNTSSLSITEVAADVPEPGRVVGMHFFNPVPAMALVECVAGEQTSAEAVAVARAAGEAMGKRVIAAPDIAGFLVNRVNRPFSLEALALLEAGVASPEEIDRIARLSGGFRMGPFELMDLIGIDTNQAVAESLYRASYGEPRYRPSALQARKIAAGALGRKTGRGWYDHAPDGDVDAPATADPKPPAGGGGDGRAVAILGDCPVIRELSALATDAGWRTRADALGDAWIVVDGRLAADAPPVETPAPVMRLLAGGSLHALAPGAVGFHALPPLGESTTIELAVTERTRADARERVEAFVASLGRVAVPVGDAPGLVLGRIVCQLINEAAFLVGEGNGAAADVDEGMTLGVNHPRGPVAWSRLIGLPHVCAVLDGLARELGDPRYRVAPLIRQRLAVGAELG